MSESYLFVYLLFVLEEEGEGRIKCGTCIAAVEDLVFVFFFSKVLNICF